MKLIEIGDPFGVDALQLSWSDPTRCRGQVKSF